MATNRELFLAATEFLRPVAAGGPHDWAMFDRFPPDDLVAAFPFRYKETCLLQLAAKFSPPGAHHMLDTGADPCVASSRGVGPLCAALDVATAPSPERLRLISRLASWPGADVDLGENSYTCLHVPGSAPDDGHPVRFTPLLRAAWVARRYGEFAPLREILAAGASLQVADTRHDLADLLRDEPAFGSVVAALAAERAAREGRRG